MAFSILVVDDDRALRLALRKAFARKGCTVSEVEDGRFAVDPLMTGTLDSVAIDVCLLDLRMPHVDGLGVLAKTQGRRVPCVVLTGHGTIEDAVDAMRLGASNFVQKPVDADELFPILQQCVDENRRAAESETLIADAPVMRQFVEKLDRAAASDEPVLLLGETGTGKEVSARRLHEKSGHRQGPFVAFNAACVPQELFESELFGHRKGAFTGAHTDREGLLARASTGTLFIDEIGDLPFDAQAKLLRAIEERKFRPVGSDVERPFQARIVAATHRDLTRMVEDRTFRADLFYRLSVVPVSIPPLRDRLPDIQRIASSWLHRLSPPGRSISLTTEAWEHLLHHSFPGNVRELINLMKRAVILVKGDLIGADDVAQLLASNPFAAWASKVGLVDDDSMRAGQRITLEALEREHIARLIDEVKNISEVARIAGIDRRTLQRKMLAWGMREDRS